MSKYTTFVGLDVHKDSIAVAIALSGGEVRDAGTYPYHEPRVAQMLKRLGRQVLCCYEAGPMGFGLQRRLAQASIPCVVVAPSLIPRRAGDRVKTDRRDAEKLARLLRSGDLQPVRVPSLEHEHLRALVRLRHATAADLRDHRRALVMALLRDNVVPPASVKNTWTQAYRRWLTSLLFTDANQMQVFAELLATVDEAAIRLARLDAAIARAVQASEYRTCVEALTALQGVQILTAATLVTELAPFSRFPTASKVMGALGLVPSEHSSGTGIYRGRITHTGNSQCRRLLIEAAHWYRRAQIVRESDRLQQARSLTYPAVAQLAREAQYRLLRRARHLHHAGKSPAKTVVALARELAGAIWKIGVFVERRQNVALPLAG